MGRSTSEGPITGAYFHERFTVLGVTASVVDQYVGSFYLPADCVLDKVRLSVAGTGGLTNAKVRRKNTLGTRVVVGDTQALSADIGVIAANTVTTFLVTGSSPFLPDSLRRYLDGNQLGVFATTDATVGARDIQFDVTFHLVGHVYVQTDGLGADFDSVA